jgi:hypothetical protein
MFGTPIKFWTPCLILVGVASIAFAEPEPGPPTGELVVDLLGLPAVAEPEKKPAPSEEAMITYANRCAQCHGEKGRGDGPLSKTLNPRPRDFSNGAWQRSVTDSMLADVTRYGGTKIGKSPLMPPHPDIEGEHLKGLIALLRSFEAPAIPAVFFDVECQGPGDKAPRRFARKRFRIRGSTMRARFKKLPLGTAWVKGFVDLDGDGEQSDGEELTFETAPAAIESGKTIKKGVKLAPKKPATTPPQKAE